MESNMQWASRLQALGMRSTTLAEVDERAVRVRWWPIFLLPAPWPPVRCQRIHITAGHAGLGMPVTALTRRQMPRVRRRLVVHHPKDVGVHGVHAHDGRQLQ